MNEEKNTMGNVLLRQQLGEECWNEAKAKNQPSLPQYRSCDQCFCQSAWW